MSNEEKEDLLYVICDTSRDNDLVRKAYDYINKLEKKNKQLKDKIKDTIKDLQENNNGDDYSLINVINILKSLLEE